MESCLRNGVGFMVLAASLWGFPTSNLWAGTITVGANANIFGAGLSVPPGGGAPASATNGATPPDFTFAAAAGNVLTFSSVTGSASFGGGTYCPPDGCSSGTRSVTGADFNPQGGISGIVDDPGDFFFLTGVFLTDSPSSTAPPTLDFTGDQDFSVLSPEIGQTFYIGDGLNDLGQTQIFEVPATATRLFLGFADGSGFAGNPGTYDDDSGSVTATFTISAAPEPSTLWLIAAALPAMRALRRRRR